MAATSHPMRHLPWPDCLNIREAGGYPIAGGGQVRWRALLRGDNLCRLSPDGCAALVDYGIRTIIDLRSPQELKLAPHPFQAGELRPGQPIYLHLPLLDEKDEIGLAALDAAESPRQVYELVLERYPDRVAAVLRGIASAAPGGILVHCHAGKDRTGLIIALALALIEVPEEIIAEDYAASDIYLQPLHQQMLADAAHDPARVERLAPWLVCHPETVLSAFRFLDAGYGGVSGYLRSAGLTEAEFDRIKGRMAAAPLPGSVRTATREET